MRIPLNPSKIIIEFLFISMAKKHIQHIKSKATTEVTFEDETLVAPIEPTESDLLDGEIAVNYGADAETLFIKNAEGLIVPFIPEKAFVNAPIVVEGTYTLGIKDGQIVRIAQPYLNVPEGDIVLDYLGNAVEVAVESNTSWDIE